EFTREDLVGFVARQLEENGVNPDSVGLEVTESVVMEDPERAGRQLAELKALGVHLALDDFGTGYSSLSYLQRFPLDSVKIDRSFVWNISASQKNLEIVRTVLNLSETRGMQVIAEGIETEEQLQQLRALGCRCTHTAGAGRQPPKISPCAAGRSPAGRPGIFAVGVMSYPTGVPARNRRERPRR